MKALVKKFSIFMYGGSRQTIEENMLGDQHFLATEVIYWKADLQLLALVLNICHSY